MRSKAVFGHAVSCLFALLAAATPALAGQLFVPVAGRQAAGGEVTHRTEMWITNPGESDALAATRFVEQGADGTAPWAAAAGLLVPAGATVRLASAAPEGRSGLIEVSARAELEVRARLVAVDASGRVLASAAVQAASAESSLAAGEVAYLQGLDREAGGEVVDLGLLNLSRQAARCQVGAVRADGSRVAAAAAVVVPPLGTRELADAWGRVGEPQLAGGRFEVTCDQHFYAHATVFRADGAVTDVVAPSQALSGDLPASSASSLGADESAADAELAAAGFDASGDGSSSDIDSSPAAAAGAVAPEGAAAPARATPPRGVVTLSVPGTFLAATASNSFISYDLAAPPGVRYRRASVDFDLTISDFNPVLLFTGVTSLRRPNRNRRDRVLYYALQLVNRNQKTVLDLGVQDRIARSQGPWQSGHTYHLTFTYDVFIRQVKLDVFESGQHIYAISGPALHPDLSANAQPLTIDFGQTGIGDGAYGPPIGWTYANLNVQLQP